MLVSAFNLIVHIANLALMYLNPTGKKARAYQIALSVQLALLLVVTIMARDCKTNEINSNHIPLIFVFTALTSQTIYALLQ